MAYSYPETLAYLKNTIPDPSRAFMGQRGVERTLYFLSLLGNPQETIKVVHVAGTSGKGSTATIISSLLGAAGFKVGLQVSPHILDIRERVQINNTLVSQADFTAAFNEIFPLIEKAHSSPYGAPTYFEIMVGLGFHIFAKEKVDYAIIEVGMGGLYDGTNVVGREDKVCAFTHIDYDHMAILGNTLSEIAAQKAGIIKHRNACFSAPQDAIVEDVLRKTVHAQDASLNIIPVSRVETSESGTVFDFIGDSITINAIIPLVGSYQASNAALALGVVEFLSSRDGFPWGESAIRTGLHAVALPGRFHITEYAGKKIILDGAHNPDKMKALVSGLLEAYPGQKFTFILGFKQEKDIGTMIALLTPIASRFVATSFNAASQDLLHRCIDPFDIAYIIGDGCEVTKNPADALRGASNGTEVIVVTGSLYLVGEMLKVLEG